MGNLAGDILQIVSPRTADDDGVIQREAPKENSASRNTILSARLRVQTAILYYRARCGLGRCAQRSKESSLAVARASSHRNRQSLGGQRGKLEEIRHLGIFFAVKDASQPHQHFRGARGATHRAVAN